MWVALRTEGDPRQVAGVESAAEIPLPGVCRGSAAIAKELPQEVTLAIDMQTPGLVVLADLWDKGWSAYLDGQPAPILRTNHALRGVLSSAGAHTLRFRYEPASLAWGLRLLALATAGWAVWVGGVAWLGRRTVTRSVSEVSNPKRKRGQ